MDGIKEHIGFEAYRLPVLKKSPGREEFEEVLGDWAPGKPFSKGPVLVSRHERFLEKQEDPFKDDMPGKATTGRLYYDYIIDWDARDKNNYSYLTEYGPPNFFSVPPELSDYIEAAA